MWPNALWQYLFDYNGVLSLKYVVKKAPQSTKDVTKPVGEISLAVVADEFCSDQHYLADALDFSVCILYVVLDSRGQFMI
jgi:hypothetical protein